MTYVKSWKNIITIRSNWFILLYYFLLLHMQYTSNGTREVDNARMATPKNSKNFVVICIWFMTKQENWTKYIHIYLYMYIYTSIPIYARHIMVCCATRSIDRCVAKKKCGHITKRIQQHKKEATQQQQQQSLKFKSNQQILGMCMRYVHPVFT